MSTSKEDMALGIRLCGALANWLALRRAKGHVVLGRRAPAS